jgi:hypothetical protein
MKEKAKLAGKPGSVVDSHSSGRWIAPALKPPTRELGGSRHRSPIWCCSGWRLPRFTPAPLALVSANRTGLVSVALFLAFSSRNRTCRRCVSTPPLIVARLIADGYYPPPYPLEPGLSSTRGPTIEYAGFARTQRLSGPLRNCILQRARPMVPASELAMSILRSLREA